MSCTSTNVSVRVISARVKDYYFQLQWMSESYAFDSENGLSIRTELTGYR